MALALVAVALTTACARGVGVTEEGTTVQGYGLRIVAPAGWEGNVTWPGPGYAITLAASTAVPSLEPGTPTRIGVGFAHVVIDDLGPPPEGIERDLDWVVDPDLPLVLTASDVLGPWTGGFHTGATLSIVLAGRALLIRVRFGAWPGEDELNEVNELLASLRVARRTLR
jgi:hypothetical protein